MGLAQDGMSRVGQAETLRKDYYLQIQQPAPGWEGGAMMNKLWCI